MFRLILFFFFCWFLIFNAAALYLTHTHTWMHMLIACISLVLGLVRFPFFVLIKKQKTKQNKTHYSGPKCIYCYLLAKIPNPLACSLGKRCDLIPNLLELDWTWPSIRILDLQGNISALFLLSCFVQRNLSYFAKHHIYSEHCTYINWQTHKDVQWQFLFSF